MALCPFAYHKLIPESHTQRRITPRVVVLHSAGGTSELYGWWTSRGNDLESHFFVDARGRIFQYMDTSVRADANGNANDYAVSIETSSSVNASEPWTGPQLQSIIKLVDWLCTVHPKIERKQITYPTGSGIGWHVQFGAPGPWTRVRGKVCPGRARIAQIKNAVIPAVRRGGVWKPSDTPDPSTRKEWTDMATEVEVRRAAAAAVKAELAPIKLALMALVDHVKDLDDQIDTRAGSLRGWAAVSATKLVGSFDEARRLAGESDDSRQAILQRKRTQA